MEKDILDVNLGDQFKVEDPSDGDGGRCGIHEDDEVAVILEAEGPVVFEKIKKESFEDSQSEDELGQVLTDEEEMIPSEDDDDNDEWEPTDDNEEEEEDGAQKDADYKLKQDKRTVSKIKKNEDDISKSCKNSQGKSHARRQKPRHHICQICNKSYKIKSLLAAHHLGKHTPKEQKPFKCPLCSYGTARKSDLERHMKLVHQLAKTKDGDYVDIPKLKVPKRAVKLERKFVCQVCGHKAFFPVHLERHMLKHSDSRPFACEYPDCKKRFRLEQHVKQHLLIHDSEQPFVCDYPGCDYRSKYQRSLNVHLVLHYPDKGLKCSTCGHISGDKTRLRLHQEVHRETLHLSCPNEDCDFRCTRQDVLRRHKMLHHNSAKIKCPHCPKAFVSEWMFRKHVDRHENGELATVAGATASLECTFCGKTCSTSYNLEQHMRTHDKNRSKKRDRTKKRPASSKKKSTVPSKKKNQVANEPVIKAEVDHIKVESNPSESCDLKTENLGTHVDVDMKMIQTSLNQACASVFSPI